MFLNSLLTEGVYSDTSVTLTFSKFIICIIASLLIGLFISAAYTYKTKHSKGFSITLLTLPSVVCMIIIMVNGSLGTGVAVAGAFSLVRFRSAPGTAKEIGAIFIAMGAGLAVGMGYICYAAVFTAILGTINVICTVYNIKNAHSVEKTLNITIPENLDYTGVFDSLFKEYASSYELVTVKSTNMGSLFKLTYDVTLKDMGKNEKQFIDDLRCRNGNLDIVISKKTDKLGEL
ncbi:DUF4956 domain-containing protein [Clostridium sp. BJN0001]|uniref:DUF4956 domain-containing protein n=1 Tax=Clostridium sp. BJN0001 TaxID=2930219 RepID=UPI001FD1FE94|nr:DUF4956 domain-containing protein [Clostridium sp. BJN0001]